MQTYAVTEQTSAEFDIRAFPNPSTKQFIIRLESTNAIDKISLRVIDMYGKTLEVRNNLSNGQTIQIGSTYRPGIYIVEMLQGTNRKQVKLMKAIN
jgi:hypothetical protein